MALFWPIPPSFRMAWHMWLMSFMVWASSSACTHQRGHTHVLSMVSMLKTLGFKRNKAEKFLAGSLGREKQDADTFAGWGVGIFHTRIPHMVVPDL